MRKLLLFSVILGISSVLVVILFFSQRSPEKPRLEEVESHGGEPGVTVKPSEKAAAGSDTAASDLLNAAANDLLNETEEQARVELEILNRQQFYSKHNTGLLKWKPYAYAEEVFAAEYANSRLPSTDELLKEGNSLLEKFWTEGDLSNPEGWKLVFKARFLANQALKNGDGRDERIWRLLEQSIISSIPADCPYSTPGDKLFDQNAFEIKQEGLREIYRVSTLHYLEVISKKPLEEITKDDMAIGNRILQSRSDSLLVAMLATNEKIREMADVDMNGVNALSAEEGQQKRKVVRTKLQAQVAHWMLNASRQKGWNGLEKKLTATVEAVEKGTEIPYLQLFNNEALTYYYPDVGVRYRFDRFVDGFTPVYEGHEMYKPSF